MKKIKIILMIMLLLSGCQIQKKETEVNSNKPSETSTDRLFDFSSDYDKNKIETTDLTLEIEKVKEKYTTSQYQVRVLQYVKDNIYLAQEIKKEVTETTTTKRIYQYNLETKSETLIFEFDDGYMLSDFISMEDGDYVSGGFYSDFTSEKPRTYRISKINEQTSELVAVGVLFKNQFAPLLVKQADSFIYIHQQFKPEENETTGTYNFGVSRIKNGSVKEVENRGVHTSIEDVNQMLVRVADQNSLQISGTAYMYSSIDYSGENQEKFRRIVYFSDSEKDYITNDSIVRPLFLTQQGFVVKESDEWVEFNRNSLNEQARYKQEKTFFGRSLMLTDRTYLYFQGYNQSHKDVSLYFVDYNQDKPEVLKIPFDSKSGDQWAYAIGRNQDKFLYVILDENLSAYRYVQVKLHS